MDNTGDTAKRRANTSKSCKPWTISLIKACVSINEPLGERVAPGRTAHHPSWYMARQASVCFSSKRILARFSKCSPQMTGKIAFKLDFKCSNLFIYIIQYCKWTRQFLWEMASLPRSCSMSRHATLPPTRRIHKTAARETKKWPIAYRSERLQSSKSLKAIFY